MEVILTGDPVEVIEELLKQMENDIDFAALISVVALIYEKKHDLRDTTDKIVNDPELKKILETITK